MANSTVFWPPQGTYNNNFVSKSVAEKRKLFFFKLHDGLVANSMMGASEYRPTNSTIQINEVRTSANPYQAPPGFSGTIVEEVTTTTTTKKSQPPLLTPANDTVPLTMTSNYMTESYNPNGPVRASTVKEVRTYVAEEEVDLPPIDLQGKYKTGTYNYGFYTKSYHPKVYSNSYKNQTFSPNKSIPLSQIEVEKEKKINNWTIKELLGCTGR